MSFALPVTSMVGVLPASSAQARQTVATRMEIMQKMVTILSFIVILLIQ
jgi:hypothetical protein